MWKEMSNKSPASHTWLDGGEETIRQSSSLTCWTFRSWCSKAGHGGGVVRASCVYISLLFTQGVSKKCLLQGSFTPSKAGSPSLHPFAIWKTGLCRLKKKKITPKTKQRSHPKCKNSLPNWSEGGKEPWGIEEIILCSKKEAGLCTVGKNLLELLIPWVGLNWTFKDVAGVGEFYKVMKQNCF